MDMALLRHHCSIDTDSLWGMVALDKIPRTGIQEEAEDENGVMIVFVNDVVIAVPLVCVHNKIIRSISICYILQS
jgi:hypothetical protein